MTLPHGSLKSADLGLQAATTQVQAWPVAAHHSKEGRGSRPSPCRGMCENSGPEVCAEVCVQNVGQRPLPDLENTIFTKLSAKIHLPKTDV